MARTSKTLKTKKEVLDLIRKGWNLGFMLVPKDEAIISQVKLGHTCRDDQYKGVSKKLVLALLIGGQIDEIKQDVKFLKYKLTKEKK